MSSAAPLPLLLVLTVLLSLPGCGESAAAGRAAAAARVAAGNDPAGWQRLDDAEPPRRLRDPRTGITFVRVPAGSWQIGPDGQQRSVRVTKPFLLAETELTVGQWQRYVAELGGDGDVPVAGAPDEPMTLSWFDAEDFCRRLGYRLPSEAEWERACRADHPPDSAPWRTPASALEHAWFNANAGTGAHATATRSPNGLGLYDMLGNVWEWCADWYAEPPFGSATASLDPVGPPTGQGRVLRGGSWFTMTNPTPSVRSQDYPNSRNRFYGVRPARSL